MIRFDNGPPDGDYVRYIDQLMAQRAAALVAATMTSDTDRVESMRAADGRKRPMSAAMTSPAFKSPQERSRDAQAGAGHSGAPDASTVSSPSSGASALFPAAATAIASAMMNREELGTVPSVGTVVGAFGIAVGIILILIGILGPSANAVLIVAGVALVSWAIKRFRARPWSAAAAPAANLFTSPPTPRASSRTRIKGRP